MDILKMNFEERLYNDYLSHNNLIVAFDFDNTIFDYHKNGYTFKSVIDILKICSDLGFTMILFTCEEDKEKLKFKVNHCKELGISVDYMNESPILNKSKKPYYNILLDDRAGLRDSLLTLTRVLKMIIKKS